MKRPSPVIDPLLSIARGSAVPVYRQIYEGLRTAILDGRLRPGQRLPSTRALALELGVSRLPVLSAFDQLQAEGYCEGQVGAGTFVTRSLPEAPPVARTVALAVKGRALPPLPREVRVGRTDPWLGGTGAFRMNEASVDEFPFRAWGRLVARHGRNPGVSLLRYGSPLGYLPFREALAAYLRAARGVHCDAEQVLVVNGSQQALFIAARALLRTGDPVWFEEPGYGGARTALAIAGAQVVPIRVDEEGMDVEWAARRCPRPRAMYVTPSHQYPLGVTMSASRRLRLLEWAQRTRSWILEDDYDSEFRYATPPVAALQGLDRDARVLYVGTLSKVLFPSLRIGYLVVPRDLVDRFAAVREALDIFPSPFHQAVLADFIDEGHFSRHLRRTRQLYRERRRELVDALRTEMPEAFVLGEGAGVHLVASLPAATDDVRIAELAAARRLWVMPLSSSYALRPRRGLVLGYGGTRVEDIRPAVRRLRQVIAAARG